MAQADDIMFLICVLLGGVGIIALVVLQIVNRNKTPMTVEQRIEQLSGKKKK